MRAQDGSPQDAELASALLKSEDVVRQLEKAFAVHQPAPKANPKHDEHTEEHPIPVSSARASSHTDSPQPQSLGVREVGMAPYGYVLPKAPDVEDLLKMLEEVGPTKEAQASIEDDMTPEKVKDEDEIWKRFVFDGDSAEISGRAFAQAREKTKHELLELIDPVDSDVAEAPSSPIPDMRSPIRDHTLSRNLLEDPPEVTVPSRTSIAGTVTSSVIPTMTSAASFAAEQGSSSTAIRFHQPPPFIGRLASTVPPPKPPRSPNKRSRGRPRKKRHFRRPNIRTMPNYERDPIESEFSDWQDG